MARNSKNTGEDIFRFIQSAFAENEGANHQEEPADVDIPPIEYKGQRVITTELMAQVYETTPKNIRMNFANHEDNFKEGIHYYFLQGEELSRFRLWANDIGVQVSPMARTLYLWTERGANRHCKILDTPKAWEQFDNLEETYFIVKETARGIAGSYTLNRRPPEVSPSGLAKLISINRRVLLDMGASPVEVGAMTKSVLDTYCIPVPVAFSQRIPEQLCFFDMPGLPGKDGPRLTD